MYCFTLLYFLSTLLYLAITMPKNPIRYVKGFLMVRLIHGVDMHQNCCKIAPSFLFIMKMVNFCTFFYIPYFFIFRTRVEWSTSKCFAASLMDLYLDSANLIILISVFSRSCFNGITSFVG